MLLGDTIIISSNPGHLINAREIRGDLYGRPNLYCFFLRALDTLIVK